MTSGGLLGANTTYGATYSSLNDARRITYANYYIQHPNTPISLLHALDHVTTNHTIS